MRHLIGTVVIFFGLVLIVPMYLHCFNYVFNNIPKDQRLIGCFLGIALCLIGNSID